MMMPATDTSVVLRTWRYAASAQGTTERVKKRLFSCCHALALGVLITVNGVVAATPGVMDPVQTQALAVQLREYFTQPAASNVNDAQSAKALAAFYQQRVFQPAWTAPSQRVALRSEEHTSELQSLMRISYAVFC